MRLLVLGGTGFLSGQVARLAVQMGHQVTCAARGVTGPPPEGSAHVRWDRNGQMPEELRDGQFDAVVDVSGLPGQVGRAVRALSSAHWVFISTVNVYAEHGPRAHRSVTAPLVPAVEQDVKADSPETYGGMKVACERLVARTARSSSIVRPGLIVGPGDPTGRFSYWPARLAAASREGLPFIAPLPQDDPVQVIDVRDLAQWIILLAHRRVELYCDAVGPVMPRSEFLARIAGIFTVHPRAVWLSPAELEAQRVTYWSGERALPVWLPEDAVGMMERDSHPARAAGLHVRDLAETAADTLRWLDADEGTLTGLGRDSELQILDSLGKLGAG